jgi:D-aminopeptidase
VILPHGGDLWTRKVPAGSFVLNGNGEATGLMWLQESGIIETPIAFTNTLSVGDVQKALVRWMISSRPDIGIADDTLTPLVLECDDSFLNDIRGQHVREEHVLEALRAASGGPVAEGSVGGGTGTMSYGFKAGIGTASRVVPSGKGAYAVGALVQANHGQRHSLRVLGAPVGRRITDLMPRETRDGSILIVLATDAPLDARNLSRVAKRSFLGLARTGAVSHHGSGDVAIAFSTAWTLPHHPAEPLVEARLLSDFHLDDLFEAAADATEEAMLNSLLAADTMEGRDGNTAYALPAGRLRALLSQSPL